MSDDLISIELYEQNGVFRLEVKENFKEKLNLGAVTFFQLNDLKDVERVASIFISFGEMILQEKLRIKK